MEAVNNTEEVKKERTGEEQLGKYRAWAKAERNSRTKQEVQWYEIQLYKDGDHYTVVSNNTRSSGGQIKVLAVGRRRGEIQRTVNKFNSTFRSLKNTVLATEVRWDSPGTNEDAKTASRYLNHFIDTTPGITDVVGDVVEYGFLRSVGYFDPYWDSSASTVCIEARDPFDLLMDRKGKYALRTYTLRKEDIRAEKDYDGQTFFNISEPDLISLPATTKQSASDIKNNYLNSKYSLSNANNRDLEEVMCEEFHVLETDEATGQTRVKICTAFQGQAKINAEQFEEDDEIRFIPFYPERRPGDTLNEPWMKAALDPQKSRNNTTTHMEEFMRVMSKGRVMSPRGANLDRISDKDGQKVEYDGNIPPSFAPPTPMGSDPFSYSQMADSDLEDVVGIHPSAIRQQDVAQSIAYLIAQDQTNTSEPFRNLKTAMTKLGRKVLKLASQHQMASKEIQYKDGEDYKSISVISPNAPNKPEGTQELKDVENIVVDLVPRGAYASLAREQTIMKLVQAGVLKNPQNIAEGLNIGNVREFVDRENQAQQQDQANQVELAKAGQQPKPGTPQANPIEGIMKDLKASVG